VTPLPPQRFNVPASVKRAVGGRDGGQCAFVGTEGRCTARSFLELHHVEPFALGGPTTVGNLSSERFSSALTTTSFTDVLTSSCG